MQLTCAMRSLIWTSIRDGLLEWLSRSRLPAADPASLGCSKEPLLLVPPCAFGFARSPSLPFAREKFGLPFGGIRPVKVASGNDECVRWRSDMVSMACARPYLQDPNEGAHAKIEALRRSLRAQSRMRTGERLFCTNSARE